VRPASPPRAEWPILAVLAVAAAGLAMTGWRRVPVQDALLVVAAAPGVGAVLRAMLPTRHVGLLAVRSRALDVLVLAALAAGIAVLALATPTGGR